MAEDKDIAPKDGSSNFDRVTEKIIEKMNGDRANPREDLSRDNEGKIVGAREAHKEAVKNDNKK